MMKRVVQTALGLVVSIVISTSAWAAEKVTVGMISSPAYHAAMWAVMNGKVSDPNVEVEVDLLPIPAMHQAALSKQYDLLPNGVLAISAMVEQGLDARIMATVLRYSDNEGLLQPGLVVRADSDIQSLEDLKGKRIAVQSVNAGYIVTLRAVLQEVYGYNASPIGGDFNWVEIPGSQTDAALEGGRVDAATYALVRAYEVANSPEYRAVLLGSGDLIDLYGGPMPSILLLTYQEKLDQRPDAIAAAARLLQQSAEYLRENLDEVYAEVAPEYNMDPSVLKGWFTEYSDMPFALSETDKKVIENAWASGVKLGVLQSAPASADELIAPQAVME